MKRSSYIYANTGRGNQPLSCSVGIADGDFAQLLGFRKWPNTIFGLNIFHDLFVFWFIHSFSILVYAWHQAILMISVPVISFTQKVQGDTVFLYLKSLTLFIHTSEIPTCLSQAPAPPAPTLSSHVFLFLFLT